jgi:aspartate aminotransferase
VPMARTAMPISMPESPAETDGEAGRETGADAVAVSGAASGPLLRSPDPGVPDGVSPTLAANEELARRQRRGEPVLPLAFGEAGLPVHPGLRRALAAAAGRGSYGPVAGLAGLRAAAAGYWGRRGLPTEAEQVVCGPGSKPLLYGLLIAIGGDVAVPRPSWVSYAAQASLNGARPHFVPTPPGEGGVPEPFLLAKAVTAARAAGREIRSVVVTLPDNPTGTVARPGTMRRLCRVAAEHGLVIISDEIYRDLIHDPAATVPSPAAIAPERTVVTTALSKSLALGGWRIGTARMPDGADGAALRDRLLGIGSEIWSTPSGPIQQAAAYAFGEPAELTQRVAASRRLHAAVARAVADYFTAAGARVPTPQAAFYLYPDLGPLRQRLRREYGVTSGAGLAALLLRRYGMGVLPGSAFGDDGELRLRVATGLLYGKSSAEQEQALTARDPLELPWIAAALGRLGAVLGDLAG